MYLWQNCVLNSIYHKKKKLFLKFKTNCIDSSNSGGTSECISRNIVANFIGKWLLICLLIYYLFECRRINFHAYVYGERMNRSKNKVGVTHTKCKRSLIIMLYLPMAVSLYSLQSVVIFQLPFIWSYVLLMLFEREFTTHYDHSESSVITFLLS